jgi:hypothetical protein
MTAIFRPEGPLFRATEHAGGPWSPEMLQGSATTALMTREVERLANAFSASQPTCCATAARPRPCRCG